MIYKKILITGGSGLVGTAFKNYLPDAIFLSSRDVDLRNESQTMNCFRTIKPDCVIHLAGKVGGVAANSEAIGEFYTDNIRINTNVLDACRRCEVSKVVSFLSTCIYPDKADYPLTENKIHNGEPHASNFGYAYTKRMLQVQSAAYHRQYGCNFICIVPNNIYGENDNFDLHNAHVLPALIRKIHEVKNTQTHLSVWGDGMVYREFTYVGDIPKIICKLLMQPYNDVPLNIGNPTEYLLSDVVKLLCNIMNFHGKIEYDVTKPKGQLRKPLSNARLLSLMPIEYTSLEDGLRRTCDWFMKNYPNIRGLSRR